MNHKEAAFYAVLWPVLMLLTVYALTAPFIDPFINLYLLFGLVLLADLCAFLLYRSASGKRENPFFLLFRFFVFFLCFAFLAYKLLSGELFRGLYTPVTAGSLTVLFSCAAGWSLTLFFTKAMVYREKLISLFAPFEKKELAARTRQYSYELQEMKGFAGQIRLVPLVFTFSAIILLVFLSFITGKVFAYQVASITVLLIFCLSFLFLCRGMEEELLLLSEGIRLTGEWQSLKARRFVLLLLLLALPAFLLSRSDLSLPFSLIEDFFSWLGKIFARPPGKAVPLPEIPSFERTMPAVSSPLMMPGDSAPRTPLLSDAMKALIKRVLMGAGIGVFILFLLHPFITRKGRARSREVIKGGLAELKEYLSQLMNLLIHRREGKREKAFYPGKIRAGNKKEKEKRERKRSESSQALPSAGKVVKAFSRLCRWGGKRGRDYRTGLSPADYLKELAGMIPHRKEELRSMARFLDDYFYSTRIIEPDEIDRFIEQTQMIIKEERKRK